MPQCVQVFLATCEMRVCGRNIPQQATFRRLCSTKPMSLGPIKSWYVTAFGNTNSNRVCLSSRGIVFVKLVSEPTSLDTDNRIGVGVITCGFSEHLHSNRR